MFLPSDDFHRIETIIFTVRDATAAIHFIFISSDVEKTSTGALPARVIPKSPTDKLKVPEVQPVINVFSMGVVRYDPHSEIRIVFGNVADP